MKTLVNHKGVVQYKHIVRDIEELEEYMVKVRPSINLSRFQKYLQHNDESNPINQLAKLTEMSPINTMVKMDVDFYNSCYENLKEGKILVFNEAGGYCFLNDDIKILKWSFLHECKEIVILERSEYVDSDVVKYLKENNIDDFLILNNLTNYTNEELLYYCGDAKTIIFKTSGLYIHDYVKLSENLESKNIIIINSPEVKGIAKFHNVKHIYSKEY